MSIHASNQETKHANHHVPSIQMCISIFVALLVFTGITVWAAGKDFGVFNTPVALGIAITKGTLVILFFMGVRHNTPLTKTVAISGFVWLLILFGITMSDYLTRAWLGVPGR